MKTNAATKKPMGTRKMQNRIALKIPAQLSEAMQSLIDAGWFRSREEIVALALRKFLNSHRPEVIEKYIRDDVAWGLSERK